MASTRTVNLADAEAVWFHAKTRKLVIQRRHGSTEVLRIPDANTVFDDKRSSPTIHVRSSPALMLEVSVGQFVALRTALVDSLLEGGTKL